MGVFSVPRSGGPDCKVSGPAPTPTDVHTVTGERSLGDQFSFQLTTRLRIEGDHLNREHLFAEGRTVDYDLALS